MPQFTVVIPVYNAALLIGRTLDALFAQAFTDFEVVAVDDGSTDGSADVVAAYGRGVRLVRQANAGPGPARNRGIELARGAYVVFLDSDDLWFPWTLANYARAVRENGHPALVAGHNRFFDDEAELAAVPAGPYRAERFADLFEFYERRPPACFPTGTIAARTDLLRAAGGFWPYRCLNEDIDLWVRLGTSDGFVRLYAPSAFGQRRHANNTSRTVLTSVEGLGHMFARERTGQYPGGPARRRARRAIMTFVSRAVTVQALNTGEPGRAWSLYRRTVAWHLALGRFRYLLGFPAVAARAAARARRAAAG